MLEGSSLPAFSGQPTGAAAGKSNNPPESDGERLKSAVEVIRQPASNPVEQPPGSNNPAGDLVTRARHDLGRAYGLGRSLRKTELARLAGLEPGRHGGDFIGRLEKGTATLSGPLEVVVRLLSDGTLAQACGRVGVALRAGVARVARSCGTHRLTRVAEPEKEGLNKVTTQSNRKAPTA